MSNAEIDKEIIRKQVEILRECLESAPVDFTGTSAPQHKNEERDWRAKWMRAYTEIQMLYNN